METDRLEFIWDRWGQEFINATPGGVHQMIAFINDTLFLEPLSKVGFDQDELFAIIDADTDLRLYMGELFLKEYTIFIDVIDDE